MKARAISALLLALILAAAMLVGCSGDIDQANEAISAANEHISEFNRLDGEITETFGQIEAFGGDDADLQASLDLCDEVNAMLARREQAIAGMKSEFDKIRTLDVSDGIKTYAAQQTEIAELRGQVDAKAKELVDTLAELIRAAMDDTLDEELLSSISDRIDTLSSEGEALQAELDEKEAASAQYFIDEGLGE